MNDIFRFFISNVPFALLKVKMKKVPKIGMAIGPGIPEMISFRRFLFTQSRKMSNDNRTMTKVKNIVEVLLANVQSI